MTDIISPEEWCQKVPAWRPRVRAFIDGTVWDSKGKRRIKLSFDLEHYQKVRVERVRLGLPVSRVEYD